MTLTFDSSNDFADVVDGLETATLKRRGSSDDVTVAGALRRSVTVREARVRNRYDTWKHVSGDGRSTASDLVWHLPAAGLSDPPLPGDVILDGDAQRWTILQSQLAAQTARFVCVTCNLAVVFGLDDTIAILKATYAKGTCGATEATWRTWKTGVRARIQIATTDVRTDHQATAAKIRYRIFIEEDLALDHTHRVRGPDGTLYAIHGTIGAERIDELQTIDAEVID